MAVVRNRAALAAGMIILFLFCSCGEMDSFFPVPQTYQVSAAVGRDSLDGSALVKEGDKIQPYFLHSIKGDPDIYGLRVVVETPNGRQIGEAILYQTEAVEGPDLFPDNPGDLSVGGGDPAAVFAEESVEFSGEDSPDVSGDAPSNKAPGLVEENTSTERPGLSSGNSQNDRLIRVKQMDEDFPPFTLPEDLEPGTYVMVFQVLGEGQKLIAKTEKTFYYIAGMDYTLTEIKASLPGFSSTPYLIQPGTPVLLEALIEADQGLDPYIVWYNGKTRIRAGGLKDGAGRFFWTIPNSLSFLHLRVEVVPFPPPGINSSSSEPLQGKAKELSLPVSTKGQIEGTLDPLLESLMAETPDGKFRFYRFEGDLLDGLDPVKEPALLPMDEADGNPLWISSGYIYGLAVGPGDSYQIPAFPFKAAAGNVSRYQVILNFKPLTPGVIFTVFFNESRLELSWEGESVILNGITGGSSVETRVSPLDRRRQIVSLLPDVDSFITLQLDFFVSGNEVTAVLGEEKINLNLVSGDEGNIQLGGSLFPDVPEYPSLPVIILDELVLIRYPDVSVSAGFESVENTRTLAAL